MSNGSVLSVHCVLVGWLDAGSVLRWGSDTSGIFMYVLLYFRLPSSDCHLSPESHHNPLNSSHQK